jgi:tetratricopeptide (TPR) repeat protein
VIALSAFGAGGRDDPIERRYGASAAREWRHLLSHIALAEGFLFGVLIVPDRDGARLCQEALRRVLAREWRALLELEPETPAALRDLAGTLLHLGKRAPRQGVWLSAVVAESAPDSGVWKQAWRACLEGLNQQRNPLRRQIDGPLLLVGAGWLVPMLRETAPDLWSVRSLIAHIEPELSSPGRREREPSPDSRRATQPAPGIAPDPDLALQETARLEHRPGLELQRAILLLRAADGLRARNDLPGAERILRQAAALLAATEDKVAEGVYIQELGRAVLDQGRASEAEALFRQSLALAEAGGATEISRGITAHELGRAVLDQGRASEAEALLRQSLALKEAGGDTEISRGITMDMLGRAVLDQGRASEAEALFRQSLALKEAGGATEISRGITAHELGRAVLDQGRASEAEALFRQSLALAEAGGDTEIARGITTDMLGRAVLDQGRASEAEALFRQSLALKEAGGATEISRGITMKQLARAVSEQGRAEDASAIQAAATKLLGEPAGQPEDSS